VPQQAISVDERLFYLTDTEGRRARSRLFVYYAQQMFGASGDGRVNTISELQWKLNQELRDPKTGTASVDAPQDGISKFCDASKEGGYGKLALLGKDILGFRSKRSICNRRRAAGETACREKGLPVLKANTWTETEKIEQPARRILSGWKAMDMLLV
jgi:hypothetical protein